MYRNVTRAVRGNSTLNYFENEKKNVRGAGGARQEFNHGSSSERKK